MTNVVKSRLVKVIFTNGHKISDACANSFGRYIMIAQCVRNVFTFYYINSSFSGKMVSLRKLKLIYPRNLQHYNNYLVPTFLIVFLKKMLTPPTFKEGRDYAFYMRDYKGETIKLLHLFCINFPFLTLAPKII